MAAAASLAALVLVALGDVRFVEQSVPGVRVGDVDPLTGKTRVMFRHADIDRDGTLDLVLPGEVAFARDGSFSDDARAPMPGLEGDVPPACDLWEADVYLRLPAGLEVHVWGSDGWERRTVAEIEWPTPVAGRRPSGAPRLVRFERFLHDLDGDDVPEVVAPGPGGLQVYRHDGKTYSRVATLEVFPRLSFVKAPAQALWPAAARYVDIPVRQASCRFFLDSARLVVLTREDAGDGAIRYRGTQYVLDAAGEAPSFAPIPEETTAFVTEPLPAHVRPCRLNDDDSIDFAGSVWRLSEASLLPAPLHNTCASTDGGKTCQHFRSPAFYPRTSFVDFDGDSRLDLITEATDLFRGSPRESLTRLVTRRTIEHEVRVHLQDARGVFPKTPDVVAHLALELDAPPSRDTVAVGRYITGDLVDLTGDFDGDGYRDLVARDRTTRLSIRFGTAHGFPSKAQHSMAIPPSGRFGVADVDGDGQSDVVVRWHEPGDDGPVERTRVHFARRSES